MVTATETHPDAIQEQVAKIIELGKLKADFSNNFRAIEPYRDLIEKIFYSGVLLNEDECQLVTGKEFKKAITEFAQSSSKLNQWHKENTKEQVMAFLMPNAVETTAKDESDDE